MRDAVGADRRRSPRGSPAERLEAGAQRTDDEVLLVGADDAGALARDVDGQTRSVGDPDDEVVVQRRARGRRRRSRARGWRWSRARGRARPGHGASDALIVGTRAVSPTRPSSAAAAAASTGTVTGAGAPAMAHSGSLRPLPGDGADDGLARVEQAGGVRLQQAGHRGGGRRLDEDALLRGQQPVGRRGSSRSVTASIRPPDSSRAASACFHEAGLPMRMAVAMVYGSRDRRAVDDRRGAGGLEAPHPRARASPAPSAAYSR